MRQKDTDKIIGVLYILTLLFLALIYWQTTMVNDPGVLQTIREAGLMTSGEGALLASMNMSAETALTTGFSVSLFFGVAWMMTRSKSF